MRYSGISHEFGCVRMVRPRPAVAGDGWVSFLSYPPFYSQKSVVFYENNVFFMKKWLDAGVF